MSAKKIEIEVAVYYKVKKTIEVSEISEDSEISENIVKELFYVDYSSESDGLVLHIDLGVGMSNYICGIHSIIKLFIQQNKKLTIEQIIDETSF